MVLIDQDNRPRPLTRKELSTFLPNNRAIRAFEKLFDLIPLDVNLIKDSIDLIDIFLIKEIDTKNEDYITTDDDDTILIDCSLNAITISLGPSILEGKTQNFVCINDTFDCIINANGLTINGEPTFQLYKNESLTIQKIETGWWII